MNCQLLMILLLTCLFSTMCSGIGSSENIQTSIPPPVINFDRDEEGSGFEESVTTDEDDDLHPVLQNFDLTYEIDEDIEETSGEVLDEDIDEDQTTSAPPITTDIELQQEIDQDDGDDCPGIEGCLTCCPLGNERDKFGCFTCDCRRAGVFADDIIITENSYEDFFKNYALIPITSEEQGGGRSKRAANKRDYHTWQKQRGSDLVRVPYLIENKVSGEVKSVLRNVFETFKKFTCIRFVPRSRDLDYIKFSDAGHYFCASHVGKLGGIQKLYLGRGCKRRGVIAHEIMHALGFDHEQARPDRDKHVNIYWRNVQRGKGSNFAKKDAKLWSSYNSEYDVDSVMHYTSYQSSRNGQATMITKTGDKIPAKSDYSLNDLLQINRMYECSKYYETVVRLHKDENFCMDLSDGDCEASKKKGWCEDSSKREVMKEKCKKTCKLCSKEHYTTPVQSPTRPTPAQKARKGCRDLLSICPAWARYNYCTDVRYKVYTRMKCKWSCGVCDKKKETVTTTTKPTTVLQTTTELACIDKKKNCGSLKVRGYCTDGRYQKHIYLNCRKTCDVCGKDTTALLTSKSTSTTKLITPAPTLKCTDGSKSCPAWAKKEFCDHAKYKVYMTKSCRKSCGFCQTPGSKNKVTTRKPVTQTKPKTTTPATTTTAPKTTTTAPRTTTTAISKTPTRRPRRRKTDTTSARTTKKRVVVITAGNTFCRDKLKSCSVYVKKKYCKRPSSKRYMSLNCRKSCNIC